VFIRYSQDTFATAYGYVPCFSSGQANFALSMFQNGNKVEKVAKNSVMSLKNSIMGSILGGL